MKFLLPFLIVGGVLNAVAQNNPMTLKDAFKNDFRIGVAVNQLQFEGDAPREAETIATQFNTISPENVLKWESVHPAPDEFDFANADQYVAFGQKNHMFIIGHNLIWHNQTPAWVFQDAHGNPISRDALIERMRKHILAVVGRYKGKIGGWDVVNEALDEDGSLRDSPWHQIIGDDYLVLAYQFAHEADPNAQLYYNDFSLENLPKRQGAIALIEKLKSRGVKIDAVGLQDHDKMDWPTTNQLDETISAFAGMGLKVMITELDVDVLPAAAQSQSAEVSMNVAGSDQLNPYANGLPNALQQKLAQRYADLFSVFVAHRGQITRVTFWGVNDGDSWLNNWPVRGRTSYPLLFDRNGNPKPAYAAVIHTAGSSN
ncbi:MAG TPA: endo-1,4-beta-xylanase [Verrucomicrobiae bacterium]|jgi:endo-1,4-beta-xylanase|nr:endo-1,4-beta-xylanase [Verrucomicrobiae bacterium]